MIQNVKEKTGDCAQLGLIVGCQGSIHAGGSLVKHVGGVGVCACTGLDCAADTLHTALLLFLHC